MATRIYRLENDDHEGPYTGYCGVFAGDYDRLIHPEPNEEDPNVSMHIKDCCGFSNLDQFHAWFNSEMMDILDFHIMNCDCDWYLSVYEVNANARVTELPRQTLFDYKAATLIQQTNIHEISRTAS